MTTSPMKNNSHPLPIASDLKALVSIANTRKTKVFAYGFMFAFIACTAFLAFSPTAASNNSSSPWFNNLFSSSKMAPYKSHLNNLFSHFFPNSTQNAFSSSKDPILQPKDGSLGGGKVPPLKNETKVGILGGKDASLKNETHRSGVGSSKDEILGGKEAPSKNETQVSGVGSSKSGILGGKEASLKNETQVNGVGSSKDKILGGKEAPLKSEKDVNGVGVKKGGVLEVKNQTGSEVLGKHQTEVAAPGNKKGGSLEGGAKGSTNFTSSLVKGNSSSAKPKINGNEWINSLIGCDVFQGKWVKDESYPLYSEGSCPHIDEPFDCFLNGRPDRVYQKLRWKPNGCSIPRLNATDMLERLRGKRLVFVGDSLNRNMWESLVCILRNSVKDKTKVFEASGKHEFRTEGSYSFLFKDYDCTVEFFRSPFLVQEWEMHDSKGRSKETLRLDIIERSSSKYKDADVIVFNTGHWWTHEKTSKGKDYYQEGNRVYNELNVVEAFHKALNTWAKWVDANVNPKKSLVFFRGYSASHFSGGQWNSGGACDSETEPIKDAKYLRSYPPKMSVLEAVIKGMKTHVSYMNITTMTDYRKDAHPSIYRKQNLSEEERRAPEMYQDCSHWCLPGVPDSWNELLYVQLIIKQYQMAQ